MVYTIIVLLLLISYFCKTHYYEFMNNFEDDEKYIWADTPVSLLNDPSHQNFSIITTDTSKILVPDSREYRNKHKYKYTPESDQYNKYINGVTALNDEINNRYRNSNLKENQQYCNILQQRNPFLYDSGKSKRLDFMTEKEDIYD